MKTKTAESILIEIKHLRPWSFSRIQKARKCTYDFYWSYVEKQKPAERADFFILGSGIHYILENAINTVFKRRKPLNYDVLKYFFEQFRHKEPSLNYEKVKPFLPKILTYANAQLRRMGKIQFFHSEVELCINREFAPTGFNGKEAFIRGKLDFVFAQEDTLYIVDHKTNRNRDFSKRIKTQLRWYALLAKAKYPEFKKLALEVHNVRYGTVRREIFTENDILNFRLKLVPIIEMVEEELLGKSFKDLTPSPSSANCRWCDFRHICPVRKE
ncbi:RecB family exonuclease [Desulfurobacterium sp.]